MGQGPGPGSRRAGQRARGGQEETRRLGIARHLARDRLRARARVSVRARNTVGTRIRIVMGKS